MAAPFDWTADVPSGVLKNHSLSKKIRREAIARTEILPFVKTEPGFGKGKGETHTITRVLQLDEPADASLVETDPIPEDELTINKVDITVEEIGRQVPFTDFAKQLLHFDLESTVQSALVDQQKLVLDTLAAGAYKATPLKYTPLTASTGEFVSDDFDSASGSPVLEFHLGEIHRRLYDTQKAPKIGSHYIGIFNGVAIDGLLNDESFRELFKYTTPEKAYKNEVGMVRSIRVIETNHSEALGVLGDGELGEGIVFGEDAAVMVEVLAPELRKKISSEFGRDPSVAWVGILGFGLVWDTFGLTRVVHVGEDTEAS